MLALQNDLSRYKRLFPCNTANSDQVAQSLQNWINVFTTMTYRISYQGVHLKNKAMERFAKDNDIKLRFVLTYFAVGQLNCREVYGGAPESEKSRTIRL